MNFLLLCFCVLKIHCIEFRVMCDFCRRVYNISFHPLPYHDFTRTHTEYILIPISQRQLGSSIKSCDMLQVGYSRVATVILVGAEVKKSDKSKNEVAITLVKLLCCLKSNQQKVKFLVVCVFFDV